MVLNNQSSITVAWKLMLGAALLTIAQIVPAQELRYKVTDLCTTGHSDGTYCAAYTLNDQGDVVGLDSFGGYTHAALWKGSTETDLGAALGSGSFSFAAGINESGIIVGEQYINNGVHGNQALIWHGRSVSPIGPSGLFSTWALGINASGEVLGCSLALTNVLSCWTQLHGQITYLSNISTVPNFDLPAAINNAGQVAGSFAIDPLGDSRAELWIGTQATDLGTLPGGTYSFAQGINNAGVVVGGSTGNFGPSTHAVVWRQGAIFDLGTLPGMVGSEAQGINDEGAIVGSSSSAGKPPVDLATLWWGGRTYNLNSLIDPSIAQYVTLTGASAINNKGWIVATGKDSRNPHYHAYLLSLPD